MPAIIKGVTLKPGKQIRIALRYLFGIGPSNALAVLQSANVDPLKKTKDLTEQEIARIRDIIERHHRIEGDLRREVLLNIKRLREIGSYRGIRHSKRLPVRGQRTKTNSRTVRGNVRKTMASGKKPATQKT